MFARTKWRRLFHENIRKIMVGMFLIQFIVFFIFLGTLSKSSVQNEEYEKNPHIDLPEERDVKIPIDKITNTEQDKELIRRTDEPREIESKSVEPNINSKEVSNLKKSSPTSKGPHSVAKSKKTISKVKKPKELNTKASSNVSKGPQLVKETKSKVKSPKTSNKKSKKGLKTQISQENISHEPDFSWNNKEALGFLKEARQQEQIVFNECKAKQSFNFIGSVIKIKNLLLTNKTSQPLDDIEDISKVDLLTPIYELTLDDDFLAQNSDEIEDMNVARGCYLKRFDKAMNKAEAFESLGKLILLNALNGFKVRLMFAGFYNIKCFYLVQEPNWFQTFHADVFVILPQNMKELQDKQAKYKQIIQSRKSKIKDRADNPLLHDPDFTECLDKEEETNKENKMNVLIIGIESVALNHFKRIFPVTYRFLTSSLTNNIFYERYNKIGENTYPNIVPSLTGLVIDSNIEYNISNEIRFYRDTDSKFHDNLPFIWQQFEKLGYLTTLNEENGRAGIFKLKKSGFRYPPTTLYTMPFILKLESIHQPAICYKNEPVFQKTLNDLSMFIEHMNSATNSKIPYFSFNFLRYFTHEFFSVPKDFDIQLKNLLESFESKSYLDNTLLILMSDHGSRLTKYSYQSRAGQRERSLPFFSMRLPKKLLDTQFHKHALANRDKIFTPHDVYKTLKQFYYINKNSKFDDSKSALKSKKCREHFSKSLKDVRHSRGISLFEQHPKNRKCSDALIPLLYCPDEPRINIDRSIFVEKTNTSIKDAASLVLKSVNQKTDIFRDTCTPFKLRRVVSIEMMKGKVTDLFILRLKCKPGNAEFEGYMQMRKEKIVLYNKVIRVDDYKDQSDCMVKESYRGFCFCGDSNNGKNADANMQNLNNNMDQFNFF